MSWGSGGQGCRRTARAERSWAARPGPACAPSPGPTWLRPGPRPQPAAPGPPPHLMEGEELLLELLALRVCALPAEPKLHHLAPGRPPPPAAARRMRRAAPPVLRRGRAGARRGRGGAGPARGGAVRRTRSSANGRPSHRPPPPLPGTQWALASTPHRACALARGLPGLVVRKRGFGVDGRRLVFERQRAFPNAEEVFPFLPGASDEHTQVEAAPSLKPRKL